MLKNDNTNFLLDAEARPVCSESSASVRALDLGPSDHILEKSLQPDVTLLLRDANPLLAFSPSLPSFTCVNVDTTKRYVQNDQDTIF